MKLWSWIVLGAIIIALFGFIVKQYKDIEYLKTQQLAIRNPAKTSSEVITRYVVKTVSEKSGTITTETTNETIGKSDTSTPVSVQRTDNTNDSDKFYLSGAYGINISDGSIGSWGMGAGYNLSRAISMGVRYDSLSSVNRIALEARINF